MLAGRIIAAVGLAALVGGMLFFGAVTAPLAFTKLPPDMAGIFIRAAFPRYYGFIAISAVISAAGLWLRGAPLSGIALALVAVLTLWLWFWMIPHLNALREAGDTAGFARGHRLSVWLNATELITAMVVLIRIAVI